MRSERDGSDAGGAAIRAGYQAQFDVPLMVSRGYASLAGEKIEETLREMAPEAEIHFERLAVNPGQIAAWRLPTRPSKTTDSRSKNFGSTSVELDAIEPDQIADARPGGDRATPSAGPIQSSQGG
jgi:hypothetical protein